MHQATLAAPQIGQRIRHLRAVRDDDGHEGQQNQRIRQQRQETGAPALREAASVSLGNTGRAQDGRSTQLGLVRSRPDREEATPPPGSPATPPTPHARPPQTGLLLSGTSGSPAGRGGAAARREDCPAQRRSELFQNGNPDVRPIAQRRRRRRGQQTRTKDQSAPSARKERRRCGRCSSRRRSRCCRHRSRSSAGTFPCHFFPFIFIIWILFVQSVGGGGGVGYQSPATGMYPPSQPPPQWNSYGSVPVQPPSVQQQQQQQQGNNVVPTPPAFFPNNQGIGGPRFPTDRPGNQSRQALSNMLRQRHPGGTPQFVPGPPVPSNNPPGPNVPGVVAPNPPIGPVGGMPSNSRVGAPAGPGGGPPNQPQFANMPMDKQRQQQQQQQQQFMRNQQQMRQQQQHAGAFGQQPVQPQQPALPQQPQQQPQQQMGAMGAPGGFGMASHQQNPMNQNFNNMFQGGAQPGMQQQAQPPPPPQQQQQQGMMGQQHFNQGCQLFFINEIGI